MQKFYGSTVGHWVAGSENASLKNITIIPYWLAYICTHFQIPSAMVTLQRRFLYMTATATPKSLCSYQLGNKKTKTKTLPLTLSNIRSWPFHKQLKSPFSSGFMWVEDGWKTSISLVIVRQTCMGAYFQC